MWDWDDDGGLAPAGDVLGAPDWSDPGSPEALEACGCDECLAESFR